jgi:glycosyltransferase involved in cell wall biosynthesis
MRLAIDASNIRAGGVTHLIELLRVADPEKYGFTQVVVFGSTSTLSQIEEAPWLIKCSEPILESTNEIKFDFSLLKRMFWQRFMLKSLLLQHQCDLLFVPGSSYLGRFRPFVTLSQNLLPFELSEAWRYRLSPMFLRFLLLRLKQGRTFQVANGLIFLSNYARDVIFQQLPLLSSDVATIPHGVNPDFFAVPKPQKDIAQYSPENPFQIIYVSIVTAYKHQWNIAKAISHLRNIGIPIQMDFIGPAYKPSLKQLEIEIRRYDPDSTFIFYRGNVPYTELPKLYRQADLAVFASSCENLPSILLEKMASGLPIACSNRGPMPEVLQDAGVYFDPEDPQEIGEKIAQLINDPALRAQLSKCSFDRACKFTWQSCSDKTFEFFQKVLWENLK